MPFDLSFWYRKLVHFEINDHLTLGNLVILANGNNSKSCIILCYELHTLLPRL